ncbi:hypothetical protein [Krasilnikovia sp. MM14-A1004]|uniref:hypothetical protein n=1 Tax=Krasilnikovia sp. MM14-A1004 TaxID=3373541 RepID=UPI00399CF88B
MKHARLLLTFGAVITVGTLLSGTTPAHATFRREVTKSVENQSVAERDDGGGRSVVTDTRSLLVNGGFERGTSSWAVWPGSNIASWANGQVDPNARAYSGNRYGATNTTVSGGGIYQDVTGLTINPGDTYCASAMLGTQYPQTGARGVFAVWLLGGTNENGNRQFNGLGNGQNWTDVHTCATATSPHTSVRVQF